MKNHIKPMWVGAALLVSGLVVAGCASMPNGVQLDAQAQSMMKASFRDEGVAKVDRLKQDEANAACSMAAGAPLAPEKAKAIEAANFKTIQWPAQGQFLGDWKEGEKIAQSGVGATWTDKAGSTNGGNCYNCHQISKTEVSFGTIGPSLYQYGKQRGVADPKSDAAKPMVEYTWGKIWNARAYSACSHMPRAGHAGILTADQIRHVMALLLDPASPVNQ